MPPCSQRSVLRRQRVLTVTVFPGTFVRGTLGVRVHPAFLLGMAGFVAIDVLAAWNVRCPRCGYSVFRLLPRPPLTWKGTSLPARCPQCDRSSGAPWPTTPDEP